jgi:hypothetical protein
MMFGNKCLGLGLFQFALKFFNTFILKQVLTFEQKSSHDIVQLILQGAHPDGRFLQNTTIILYH